MVGEAAIVSDGDGGVLRGIACIGIPTISRVTAISGKTGMDLEFSEKREQSPSPNHIKIEKDLNPSFTPPNLRTEKSLRCCQFCKCINCNCLLHTPRTNNEIDTIFKVSYSELPSPLQSCRSHATRCAASVQRS